MGEAYGWNNQWIPQRADKAEGYRTDISHCHHNNVLWCLRQAVYVFRLTPYKQNLEKCSPEHGYHCTRAV